MDAALMQKIAAIPEGKSLGARTAETYYLVARRPEGLVVECGWTVPEQHQDDADSYTYNPFKGRAVTPPWVGRRAVCVSAAEAVEVYAGFKAAVLSRQIPSTGETIGSVTR